ncbi:MAG: acyl-CoA dehydrogenase [Sphingopyxis sp.]|nr:acyl-CoA dehydrogenase [Sphingopyxis sp.]
MSDFSAPSREQQFLLRHVAGLHELPIALDADLVDAIVEGAADIAENAFAPLDRVGDTVKPRWADGRVTMPPGFCDAYAAYVEGGWGSLAGDTAYGGQGLPFSLMMVANENLFAASLGFSICFSLTTGAIEALEAHGSDAQKRTWLPRLMTGEWSGTMNLTEPQAGSDVGALRTVATPADDGLYRIRGQKIFISFGEHDLTGNIVHLVLARTPDSAAGTRGISLFLVPKYRLDAEGRPTIDNDVRCVSIEHKLGLNGSPTCVMAYGDRGECYGELIGEEHGGMRAMFTMINNARLNVANQGVGVAERARQKAAAFARDRVQSARADGSSGGKPVAIVGHPDVRRMLMRMNALTQGARALLYYAAGQVDRANAGAPEARARLELMTPLAKSFCTDVACEVSSLAIQVHGGIGFIEETGVAQHYRDARILPIYEGTNGIQAADLVGRKLARDGGAELSRLIGEIRGEAGDEATLIALCGEVERVAAWMLAADVNDRLAGSQPFQTMVSVLVAGWLMARQLRVARIGAEEGDVFVGAKISAARFFLDCLVSEALGLAASATMGAAPLYALDEDMLLF